MSDPSSRQAPVRVAVLSFLLALGPLVASPPAPAQQPAGASGFERLARASGSGSFVVEGAGGYEGKRITVHYHKPESLGPGSPVVMVMPGAGRDGDEYRDAWVEASEAHGVLVLSPAFSRLAIFRPGSRARRILAANSGWYTEPAFDVGFPYGLDGTRRTPAELRDAFGTRLVVFLGGEDDADETRGSVRRTPEAQRQGAHRLARGRHFFRVARKTAEEIDAFPLLPVDLPTW